MRRLIIVLIFFIPFSCCADDKKMAKQVKPAITAIKSKNDSQITSDSTSKMPKLPALAMDSLNNLRSLNYNTEITPIQPNIGSFSDYKGKNFMVLYFSIHCGHCKAAMPYVMSLAKELETLDIPTMVIATQSSKPELIPPFIEKLKVNVPTFRDHKRAFSVEYGTGFVPLILLINKNGNFIQLRNFNKNQTPDLIKTLFKDPSLFPK